MKRKKEGQGRGETNDETENDAPEDEIEGRLLAANEQEITLLTEQKEEVPGKKGKKLVEREITIPFTEMTEAKVMIRFK